LEQFFDVEHSLDHSFVRLFNLVGRWLIGHLPLGEGEVSRNFEFKTAHVLRQRLENDFSLLRENCVMRLLIIFDFYQFARVFDLAFESQQLLKRMVKEDDFFRCLVRQDLTNFFKSFGAFEQ
jgi:hypothetical protein